MKVKLLRDTVVRFSGGTVIDVSKEEAARLIAFRNAEPVKEPAKKATKKK